MAPPLEVSFTITGEDLVERVVLLTERSPSIRSGRLFRKVLSVVLLLLLGGMLAFRFGPWAGAPFLPIAAAYALLFDRIVSALTRRYARRYISENPAVHATGPRRLVLDGNSVRVETPSSTSTIRIEGPVRVEEIEGFAHVELGGGEALFLPLRPADRGDPRAFVEALRARAVAGSN